MANDPNPDPPLDAEMDAALRDAYAFAPGAAEEAAARFRTPPPAVRWPWVLVPAALAAGLAAGILLSSGSGAHPGEPFPPPLAPRLAGFLAVATGPVCGAGGETLSAGDPIHEGQEVLTGADSRASLVLSDGTEVRLDRGARVVVARRRNLTVKAGRIWSRVSPGTPFLIHSGEAMVDVLGTVLSVAREPGTTRVQLFSGRALVAREPSPPTGLHGGEDTGLLRPLEGKDLAAGQEVEVTKDGVGVVRPMVSEALATGWMLELVAHAGSHDRELAEHIDRLLVDLGRTKAVMVEERALVEDLGKSCRVPLARYLVSEGARWDLEPRRKAARVLARIADDSVAAELAAALRDPDPDVRVAAARAVQRVSKGAACADPESFRGGCDLGAAAGAEIWARSCAPVPPK